MILMQFIDIDMNKEKIKKIIKKIFVEYRYIALAILIFSVALFWDNLFNGQQFAWYNDQKFQHNIFYQEWYRVIRETIENKRLSFYSWNTFLGTDFFVSKLLYCVGDFLLTPFFIVYSGEINFDLLFTILTIVCFLVSGITMNKYLCEFGIKKRLYRNGFSIIYAFSGFVVTYAGTYMFHRFYSLLPLLFCFVEKYNKKGKTTAFSMTVALLFMQNYELMFSVSIFLIMYFIFSNKIHYQTPISEILKKSLKLILAYLIGLALCGFAVIPLFYFIKSNPRVASFEYGSMFWDYKVVISFLSNLICPAYNFRTDNPPYLFYTGEHFSSEFGIFATAIVILGIIHLWKNGNREEKIYFLGSEILIMIFIFIRPLNMLVHGFSEPTLRWSFLLIFFHTLMSAYSLDKYLYRSMRKESIMIVMIFDMLLLVYLFVYNIDLKRYLLSIVIIMLSGLLILIYDALFASKKDNVAFVLGTVNSVLFLYLMIIGQNNYQTPIPSFNKEYIKFFIDTDDDKLFRYYFNPNEIQPFSSLNLNVSIEYDYMTTSTYDSTYDATVYNFLRWNCFDSWIIDINQSELMKMLGVKYVGVLDDTAIINDMNTEFVYNLDDLNVYKIIDYNNIGHTYSKFVTDHSNINWNNELIIDKKDIKLVEDIVSSDKVQMNVIEYNRQYFKGEIDAEGKCVLFVAIPYSEGWNIKNQDGEMLQKINVQGGFLGVIIDENDKEINFYYGTPGIKQGVLLSGVGLLALVFCYYLRSAEAKKKDLV